MVKPDEILEIVTKATAVMRAKGVRRLRLGDLELDLTEESEPEPPPGVDWEGPRLPEPELFSDSYEDPDLYGGRVPKLRRPEG